MILAITFWYYPGEPLVDITEDSHVLNAGLTRYPRDLSKLLDQTGIDIFDERKIATGSVLLGFDLGRFLIESYSAPYSCSFLSGIFGLD